MHTDNQVISVLAAVAGASVLWWKCDDVITSSSVSAVCPRVTAWLHDCMTPPTLHAAYCGHLPANHLQLALTHTATIAKVLVHTHRCQYCQYQHIKITTSTQLHPVYASALQPIWQCSCSPLRAKYLLMIFIPDAEFIVAECPGDAEDTPSARQGERWRWCA